MKGRYLVGVVIFFTLSSSFSFAQEATHLGEVVVTATRTPQGLQSAPGQVFVVTGEKLEHSPGQTVDSALGTLPGVFNRRANLMDTLQAVTLGGIPGQNRSLVVLDGVPINNAYTGDVNLVSLPLGDVERIEVAQGPFSSLYGGNAMGGVVSIFSKRPEKRSFTFSTGYGSSWHRGEALDDWQRHYFSYGDKWQEKAHVFFSYGFKATNGYPKDLNVQSARPPVGITGYIPTTDYQGNPRYIIGDKGDNTWWDDSLRLKFSYDFSKTTKIDVVYNRLRYRYNYDEPHTYLRNASGQLIYSYSSVREASFASGSGYKETGLYSLALETQIGEAKAKMSLGLNDEGENWYTLPNTSAPYATLTGKNGKLSSTPNQNYLFDLQVTYPLFKRHLVTVGGAVTSGKADTEEYSLLFYKDEDSKQALTYNAGGKTRNLALFAQDEIRLFSPLTLWLGVRYDYWETFDGYANQFGTGALADVYPRRSDSAISPKGALVYKPFRETIFKASLGQAFRPPTIYELYRTWVGTGTPQVTYKGNPDLKPEKTTSWDVAVAQGLWSGARVELRYFVNHLTDLIYRKTGPVVGNTRTDEYINAGKAKSEGVSGEIEQRLGKIWRLFANFTYTDARIKENVAKPQTVGKRLTQIPERMGNAGLEMEWGPIYASVIARYVGKRYATDDNSDEVNGVSGSYDPYLTVDARLKYRFLKYFSLCATVTNINGEDYFYSYKAPGRAWFLELEMRF